MFIKPFTFPSFLLPIKGLCGRVCMMIQTSPFLITHVGPVYFSLCSFISPFYLSICRFHCSYYFLLACFQSFILSNSQNKIDITVFFSLRTFAYLFTFSFYVIIIFIAFRLLSLSISTFFFLFFFLKLNSFEKIWNRKNWWFPPPFFIIFCLVGLLLPDLFSPYSHGEYTIFSVVWAVSIMKIKYWGDDRPTTLFC